MKCPATPGQPFLQIESITMSWCSLDQARQYIERALAGELASTRVALGLSQTEVAARMGTSQSAVARLESGSADVRASTLERYAAAVGGQITWKLDRPAEAEGTSQ